jgi:hypothetical protein
MHAMGDLKRVAAEITRKLDDGSLPMRSDAEPTCSPSTSKSDTTARPRQLITERLTGPQAQRREAIKAMLLSYRMERRMEAPSADALNDEVRWCDELFTHNEIPTDRLHDIYLEAMSHHGPYPLKPNDYVDAWRRLQPKQGDGVDLRAMSERGGDCTICRGAGTIKKFVPDNVFHPLAGGEEVEVICPYRCNSALAVRQAGQRKAA